MYIPFMVNNIARIIAGFAVRLVRLILRCMIGIDEVGRGCWAGPLLIVAARQISILPLGLKDSKLLSKKQRELLVPVILDTCEIGEGWVTPAEIDALGLSMAMRRGTQRALSAIHAVKDEEIIFDGNINYCDDVFKYVTVVPKADNLYPIVSAASIVAKVKRDAFMAKVAVEYPDYQFERHVGYGTKLHIDALKEFGISPIHRLSYKPIQALL